LSQLQLAIFQAAKIIDKIAAGVKGKIHVSAFKS